MRKNWMIRQGWIAAVMMLVPIIFSLLDADHNSLTQHMSEYEATDGLLPTISRYSTVVTGLSVSLFAIGCLFGTGRFRFSWTFVAALVFGLAMLSNGVFTTGTPMHGLHGLAVFLVLVPTFYAAEFGTGSTFPAFVGYSLLTSLIGLLYIWALIFGFDPEAWRGLTQRLASLVTFLWFAVAALSWRPAYR
ncbi:DUF998 domain-containing protein [uncultured Algimonas sp.]|uniref:DUF998 domain-containing protein n=1 Tax=uncultured Algimonas sp. TaxID=1547920 RepID=UPI002619078A|nr:DUF998 domain-containing protein [uncultured Algimonas sp.]